MLQSCEEFSAECSVQKSGCRPAGSGSSFILQTVSRTSCAMLASFRPSELVFPVCSAAACVCNACFPRPSVSVCAGQRRAAEHGGAVLWLKGGGLSTASCLVFVHILTLRLRDHEALREIRSAAVESVPPSSVISPCLPIPRSHSLCELCNHLSCM